MTKQEHTNTITTALGELVNDDALPLATTIEVLEQLERDVQRELAAAREADDRQESEGGA